MTTQAVRAAYEQLGEGDVEPFIALLASEMEWRGRRTLAPVLVATFVTRARRGP